MWDLFDGWEQVENVKIPKIGRCGFKENVLIREVDLPEEEIFCEQESDDETVLARTDYSGTDETVFAARVEYYCVLKRMKTGESFKVAIPEFIIGKQVGCDFTIKDNPMISRKHACIYFEQGEFWVKDLNSLNHTFIEDEEVKEAVKLKKGMKIKLSLDEEFEILEYNGE